MISTATELYAHAIAIEREAAEEAEHSALLEHVLARTATPIPTLVYR